jgi:uncharacterized protein YndB with AHSA1/START domain
VPRTDSASRVIAAPPEHVYAALVEPEAVVAWLPPDGMTGRFDWFDARADGSYRMVLTYAEPSSGRGKTTPGADIVEARFVELVPGERVVQMVTFDSADASYAGPMTLRWELGRVDTGTRITIRAENVPDGISAEEHAAGMASSLANLATYLES